MSGLLYHLVAATDWPDGTDDYSPASLNTEGFIHLSNASQAPDTSLRYYADVADLMIVTIDPTRLTAAVEWEDLVGHGAFPHLYGSLNRDAIESIDPYVAGTPIVE